MNRVYSGVCLLLASTIASADDLPALTLDAPDGWTRERIELPPGFAPDMDVAGYEEIRFAPGMFQADSDSFFSYVIVFVLAGDPPDRERLQQALLTYYRGLAAAVGPGRGLTIDTDAFTFELAEPEREEGDDDSSDDPHAWIGTLNWTEPFVTGAAQELRLEINVAAISGHDASRVTMSVAPSTAPAEIRETMRTICEGAGIRE